MKENIHADKIISYFRNIFEIPKSYKIEIITNIDNLTEIIIFSGNKYISSYSFKKNISEISDKDIIQLKESAKERVMKKHPLLGRLFVFFGWWFIFTGSYTFLSVCPCCGQVGCPIGIGVISVYAGLLAITKTYLNDIFENIKKIFSKIFIRRKK